MLVERAVADSHAMINRKFQQRRTGMLLLMVAILLVIAMAWRFIDRAQWWWLWGW
jgi:hypothetical protein